MAFSYACLTLQRVVLPIILILGALYRPVGISFVYLLMFFVSPFVPLATDKSSRATFSAYFIILIALSTILILCHIGLQVSIIALKIGDMFGTCTVTERLLRHIGFIGFQNLNALAIVEWLTPEVMVFITTLAVYIISKKIAQKHVVQVEHGNSTSELQTAESAEENAITPPYVDDSTDDIGYHGDDDDSDTSDDEPNFDGLIRISPLFCLAALFFSAVLRPSVPGGIYFLTFLVTGSYWATFKLLQKKFAIMIRSIMCIIVAHTICIVAYQTPWMQEHLDKQNLIARLIGLEPLATSTCSNDIRIIVYDTDYKVDSFLNPIVLLITYHILSLTSKHLIHMQIVAPPATAIGQETVTDNNSSHKIQRQLSLITQATRNSKKDDSRTKTQCLNVTLRRDQQRPQIITEPTETTPLMHTAQRNAAPVAPGDTNRISGGSGPHTSNDIPLNSMEKNRLVNQEDESGILDQIAYGIMGIGGFIYQNSYIFTNVLMMAWSIIYHSWLTFVLLLWANALWMIPNQRKAMMRSSLFIVIYAELLLIAQYIYGMDLTNDELPSKIYITGINLGQIGFDRPQEHGLQPCIPLIVKTSFLLMFWVTLRQFFREKTEPGRRRHSSIADIFAATSAEGEEDVADGKKTSKFLKKIGNVIKNLLVRLWIWLLILVIFLCAITGEQMTAFRICYMALFLFFLLVFQSSSKAWVKLMYGFWLFLIFYAMSILILIYTYQFDKFDEYWADYLNVAKTLQDDIGLERYKTKDLLLHFIPPTLIVILTVIQVHYFHSRFIASMSETPTVRRTSSAFHPSTRRTIMRQSRQSEYDIKDFTESAGELMHLFLKRCRANIEKFLRAFKGVFWSLLELHWIKVVYVTAFVCAVSEVSLLHVPFIVLCVFGTVSSVRMRVFFSRIISLVVTIIVLSKMIYQISYLDHSTYNSICMEENGNARLFGNNAQWFGLVKVDSEKGLIVLLQKYIIYMVVATLHAVITLRQYQMRRLRGTENDPLPKVPFPTVTRDDAERNLGNMIRYLLNYGFYKFGYEICMITLVSTITYRQDIVAVIYSVWLVMLLIFRRTKIVHFWGVFQVFLVISIIVQYILLVQVPPKMCMTYIWEESLFSNSIQRWAMLPGNLKHDHTPKLIFDFVLLLLVNRQKRVYTIETVANFPGGSNQSVMKDINNLGKVEFINPTHDFLSHVRNYLDIFNHAILCGFYWVTLAVVFLAGTSIADILALGYLIGAFIFLWEGSDFYLRPIKQIVRRWKILIIYNVTNIVVKTCLQMAGCMFMETLVTNCCWFVHVLGINCARTDPTEVFPRGECPPIRIQVVLLWDSICFAFLIFQMRIFQSHYFCHIITDTRANNILASRGADIIESLRQKKIAKRQEYEEDILHKIKRKMEKIRATQQKMLRPLEKPTHFDGLRTEVMPTDSMLNSSNSFRSSNKGSGYHTPDGDADNNMATTTTSVQDNCRIASDSDNDCDVNQERNLRLPLPEIEIESHTPQPATPSTDALTMPLEGFLEAPRLSCFSRTHSDLSQPKYNDSEEDETNEVFTMNIKPRRSPLLLCAKTLQADVNEKSIASSLISSNVTRDSISSIIRDQRRRQSSCNNAVSWNDTVSIKCPSANSPKPTILNTDEAQMTLSKCLHRRHQSVGNAKYAMEDSGTARRRSSNLWWAQEEVLRHNAQRPNSWGPVEHGNPVYSSRPHKRKEIKLHPHAVRAGDYYMFDDVDDKFELDLIADAEDIFDHDHENITQSDMKMNRRMTLYNVWKDISIEAYRRQVNLLQRSYASAPLSNIDLLCDEHFIDADNDTGVGIRISTLSEPLCYAQRSTSEYFEPSLKSKSHIRTNVYGDPTEPSTSKGEDVQAEKSAVDSEARQETLPPIDSEDLEDHSSSDAELQANPIIRLIEGFLVTLTIRLNRFSRNYRKVNKILEEEKKTLKESSTLYLFYGGLRTRTAAAIYRLMKRNVDSDVNEDDATRPQPPASSTSSKRNSANIAPPPSILNKQQQQQQQQVQQQPQQQQQPSQIHHNNTYESMQSQSHDPQSPPLYTTISSFDPQQQQQQQQQQQHTTGDINAIEPPSYDVVDSTERRLETSNSKPVMGVRGRKSEPLPEIRIKAPSFEHSHRGSGSLISKRWSQDKVTSSEFVFDEDDFTARDHNVFVEVLISAWYAILSNTDIICYIVAFIDQIHDASLLTLPLPLMIFFWGTLSLPRPSKTFWITLIAYTQATVLIKCIFQFKLIWSNYHYNLPNNPLGIEKLFGIQMSTDFATWDLWLLLSLFFHRYILKSHGLWKVDSYVPIVHSVADDEDKISMNESAASDQDVKASEERRESGGFDNASCSENRENCPDGQKLVMRVGHLHRHKYLCGLSKFFHNLLHKPRLPTDVYALMFLCDFINFFVLLFGFTAFSSKLSDGGVKTYLAENKVPVPFLIMLLVQFLLIVIDRALYLRKALKFKIAFHFISVVGIHIWMFFIVPLVTERSFYASAPPIIFYFIKCFYLLLSSYQIKCGYPTRILGNFLTKSFSMVNMIAFKVYMVVPFLYELRTILDWLCTDTTMTLFDWLKMEDIFANIYSIKCVRQMETDFPAVRATKKATYLKLLMGGAVILIIVLLIWGPLTLFALFNAVGQSNVPKEARLFLRIGSYEPIYVTSTREATYVLDEEMFSQMKNAYIKEKEALSFLLNYHASDIAAIKLSGNSPTTWNIAPPDKERLIEDLKGNTTLTIRLAYEITRTPPSKTQSGTVSSEITFAMNRSFPYRKTLLGMINGTNTTSRVIIPQIVPKFIKVLNSGDAINVHALFIDRNSTFRDLAININSTNDIYQWWEIADYCNDDANTVLFQKLPLFNCSSGIVFYTFNDKKFPSTWTFITAGGIIGIYTTFVLVVSRFLKGFLGGQTRRIMYEDLPNVDRVLQLCLDIYLVREALEFMLEEDLFAKLLFLYRSPETLIKWTRPPEEHADDETDTESVRSKISGRRGEHQQQQQ